MASSLKGAAESNPDPDPAPAPEHASDSEIRPAPPEKASRSSSHSISKAFQHNLKKRPSSQSSSNTVPPANLNKFPGFGQWLKSSWLDIISMVMIKGLAFFLYTRPPAVERTFLVTLLDGRVADPDFAFD